ncbi:MAG: patatin-like phospholipase family protein [Endomicrobiales bacterium]|nr:patatin-like phospholipase family protein [Endomicrobiales bacterium]
MVKKIGLALGGGGARGLTHLGILSVLEEEKIPLYCIAGTSMGAILGACYAVEPNIGAIIPRIREVISGSLFSKLKIDTLKTTGDENESFFKKTRNFFLDGYLYFVGATNYAFFELSRLEEFINMLLPDINISQTKIPFACTATDITNGRKKIFTKGSLRKAVLASSAIAGVFPPVNVDGIYYNDGGYVSLTPVDAAKKLNADFIIACDVKSRIIRWEKPEKANDIMARVNFITANLYNEIELKKADIVISPAVKHIHWTEFNKFNFLVEKGKKSTSSKIWEIKAKLKSKGLIDVIKNLFRK